MRQAEGESGFGAGTVEPMPMPGATGGKRFGDLAAKFGATGWGKSAGGLEATSKLTSRDPERLERPMAT